MNYKYDIYDTTHHNAICVVATERSMDDALATVNRLKAQLPQSRFLIKPEYDLQEKRS